MPPLVLGGVEEPPNRREEPPTMRLDELKLAPAITSQEKTEENQPEAQEEKSMVDWLLRFSGFLTHSQLMGSSQILGGNGSAVVAPVIHLDDKKTLIPVYNASYRKSKQIFAQDEGPKLFSEDLINSFTPTLRYAYSEKIAISPMLFYTDMRTKETSADTWHNGLYNYKELGAGINVEYLLSTSRSERELLTFATQLFYREYPNFKSPASIAGISFEEDEKDFDGFLLSASYAKQKAQGLSHSTTLTFLNKDFRDKLIETPTGERTNENQHDFNLTLSEELVFRKDQALAFRLTGSLSYTDSNQNLAEGSFPNITFQDDYYSALLVTLKPGISYAQTLENGRSITYSADYTLSRLGYDNRRAKNSTGTLKAEKERDWTQTLVLNAIYTLNKNWNLGAIAEYTKASSNMEDERVYLYDYEILNLSVGASYKF